MDNQASGFGKRKRYSRRSSLVPNTKETSRGRPTIFVEAEIDRRCQIRFASLRARDEFQSLKDLSLSGRLGPFRVRKIRRRHKLSQRSFHALNELQYKQEQRDLHEQQLR